MDLKEATAIVRRQSGSLHEWTAAASFVHSYYQHHPKHLRPVGSPGAPAFVPAARPSAHDDLEYTDDIGYAGRPRNGAPAGKPKPAKEPPDLEKLTRQV